MPPSTCQPPDLAAVCERLDRIIGLLAEQAAAKSPGAYLSPPELAKYLGVSLAAVKKWRASGELPRPARIGRCVMWLRADIDAHMQKGKRK